MIIFVLEVNNNVIIQFGCATTNSTVILPISYTKYFSIAISQEYGDAPAMRTNKINLSTVMFSTKVITVAMYYIVIGF